MVIARGCACSWVSVLGCWIFGLLCPIADLHLPYPSSSSVLGFRRPTSSADPRRVCAVLVIFFFFLLWTGGGGGCLRCIGFFFFFWVTIDVFIIILMNYFY